MILDEGPAQVQSKLFFDTEFVMISRIPEVAHTLGRHHNFIIFFNLVERRLVPQFTALSFSL